MEKFHNDREKAISWFKNLPFIKARSLSVSHLNRLTDPSRLTGREIENIWKKEVKGESAHINQ